MDRLGAADTFPFHDSRLVLCYVHALAAVRKECCSLVESPGVSCSLVLVDTNIILYVQLYEVLCDVILLYSKQHAER